MSGNPVDDFLLTKDAAMQQKRQDELNHLDRWRNNGKRPEDLDPLLKSFEPVFAQKVRQWRAPTVPEAAFRAQLQKHFIGALESFDPSRGAQLATHVENRLQKVKRYNLKHQNLAYIPEGQAMHIGRIQRAQDELTEEYGRAPTFDELGDHLGMQPKRVQKIVGAQRRDIPASSFENDPAETALQRDQEVLELLPYNLSADEKTVFNHIFGRDGHQKITSTNDLAKKLGKSPSQVSRLRTAILGKYNQYK